METRVGVDVSMATGAEEKEEDFDLFGSDEVSVRVYIGEED